MIGQIRQFATSLATSSKELGGISQELDVNAVKMSELSTGAGAIALSIAAEPHVIELEPQSGYGHWAGKRRNGRRGVMLSC